MDPVQLMGGEQEVFFRLAVATVIGSVLGINRDLRDKPAGLRTHALVALGAALVTVTSQHVGYVDGILDGTVMARVIQGVMSGIGFLGGGVILRDVQRNDVYGLTTAASIWLAAGLGIACGAGFWVGAVTALIFTLAVLIGGGSIERVIYQRFRGSAAPSRDRE